MGIQQFFSQQGRLIDIHPWVLYHRLPENIKPGFSASFFTCAIGQEGLGILDTNMATAGRLPYPRLFLLESIFIVGPESGLRAIGGILEFRSFNRVIYQAPVQAIPQAVCGLNSYLKFPVAGNVHPACTSDITAGERSSEPRPVWPLTAISEHGYLIEAGVPFSLHLYDAPGWNNLPDVYLVLDGVLIRNVA